MSSGGFQLVVHHSEVWNVCLTSAREHVMIALHAHTPWQHDITVWQQDTAPRCHRVARVPQTYRGRTRVLAVRNIGLPVTDRYPIHPFRAIHMHLRC